METHSSNLIYNCKQCDFKTNTKPKFIFHKRKVHLGIRYECKVCNFKTAKSSNLYAHQLIHSKNEDTNSTNDTNDQDTNEIQFQCDQCNRTLESDHGLMIHKRIKHNTNRAKTG